MHRRHDWWWGAGRRADPLPRGNGGGFFPLESLKMEVGLILIGARTCTIRWRPYKPKDRAKAACKNKNEKTKEVDKMDKSYRFWINLTEVTAAPCNFYYSTLFLLRVMGQADWSSVCSDEALLRLVFRDIVFKFGESREQMTLPHRLSATRLSCSFV